MFEDNIRQVIKNYNDNNYTDTPYFESDVIKILEEKFINKVN